MLTLLFFEDDPVCRRLKQAIHWDVLSDISSMFLGGGVSFLEALIRYKPDIVITSTDILEAGGNKLLQRAPDLDCDLVVVCPQEQMQDIQLESADIPAAFILCPCDAEEVESTLLRIAALRNSRKTAGDQARYEKTLRLLRNAFMLNIITERELPDDISVELFNRQYRLNLHHGVFQVMYIVFSGLSGYGCKAVLEQMIEDMRSRYVPVCWETIPLLDERYRITLLFNYDPAAGALERFPEINRMVISTLRRNNLSSVRFYAGLGEPVTDISLLHHSLSTAKAAILCHRIRMSNGLIIYGNEAFDKTAAASTLDVAFQEKLRMAAEQYDINGFCALLRSAFSRITIYTDPSIVVDICRTASEIVKDVCRISGLPGADVNRVIDDVLDASSVQGIYQALAAGVTEQFSECMAERQKYGARHVREAVEYISRHYSEKLTLADIAGHLHLNPSYFSVMFKKETSHSFSEYLTICRIEGAKKLLRSTNLSITEVRQQVGYTDSRHFREVFTRLVGSTPSDYRAMHS